MNAVVVNKNGHEGVYNMQTLRGIYRNGRVELFKKPPKKAEQMAVLITFLADDTNVDLKGRGMGQDAAANLRYRLQNFAPDWDRPEMDVYDEI